MNKKLVVLGTRNNPYTYFTLKALAEAQVPVWAIVLDTKVQSAKELEIWAQRTGKQMIPGSLDVFRQQGAVFHEFNHNEQNFADFIHENSVDLLVNGGTPRILKANILRAPSIGILNVHPSILPKYRGCTTTEWGILNDDPIGNTAHFMTESIDEGPIIAQESYDFLKSHSYQDIRTIIYQNNFKLLAKVCNDLLKNDIKPADLPAQAEGQYWPVIDGIKLDTVMQKIANGLYKYQH